MRKLFICALVLGGCSSSNSSSQETGPLKSVSCSLTLSGLTGASAALNGIQITYEASVGADQIVASSGSITAAGDTYSQSYTHEPAFAFYDTAPVLISAPPNGSWGIKFNRSTSEFTFSYLDLSPAGDGHASGLLDSSNCTLIY